MECRKYLLTIVIMLCLCVTVKAQDATYERSDSTLNVLYQSADWQQLIRTAEGMIKDSVDYPALRSKLGYAYMMTGNYSGAVLQFRQVFKNDSYNQEARYYAYLCHLYLNQLQSASYNASYLDTSKLAQAQTGKHKLLFVGVESGIKYTDEAYRDNAFYTRVFLTNRLSWKLQLDQSVSYFNQMLQNQSAIGDKFLNFYDQQWEYYGKISFPVSEKIILFGSAHYLNTKYKSTTYYNLIGGFGLKYAGTYADLQTDASWGYMLGQTMSQYNGQAVIYPLGNLNLYTISRLSLVSQQQNNQVIFSQGAGFKVFRHFWAETMAVFGKLDNYMENDGLYTYNSVDVTSFKIGETGFYQLSRHAQLRLNYTFENKRDAENQMNYHQHSFTTGVLWNF